MKFCEHEEYKCSGMYKKLTLIKSSWEKEYMYFKLPNCYNFKIYFKYKRSNIPFSKSKLLNVKEKTV